MEYTYFPNVMVLFFISLTFTFICHRHKNDVIILIKTINAVKSQCSLLIWIEKTIRSIRVTNKESSLNVKHPVAYKNLRNIANEI
jgi:hypothetical protein